MNVQRIEISYKTIVFTVVFLLFLWFLFQIRDILSVVFLSVIIAAGLRTPVNWLEERLRLPRMVAILIAYIILLFLTFLLLYVMVPTFILQTIRLIQKLDNVFQSGGFIALPSTTPLEMWGAQITDQLSGILTNILRGTVAAFSIVINFFTVLVLSFYMLLERRHMRVFLKNILGEELKERVVNVILKIEDRLGSWVRGMILLMVVIGLMTYIGLVLLGIEYALPLAILAGLLEIIPIIGPIVSAIPAIIIALLINPWLALAVLALYFIVQQLENHLIVPQVMKQAVGIPPVITILAILVGGSLAGIAGALLSIPLFISLQILFQEFVSTENETLLGPKDKTEEK